MMKVLIRFTFLLMLSACFGCDDDIEPPDPTHSGLVEEILLQWETFTQDHLSFEYDDQNRIASIASSFGAMGTFSAELSYDSLGRLVAFQSTGDCDFCYSYQLIYGSGQIHKIIYSIASVTDNQKIVSELKYNALGNIASKIDTVINLYSQDTAIYKWVYGYYQQGYISLKRRFDQWGRKLYEERYQYDDGKNPFDGLFTNYDGAFEFLTYPNNVVRITQQSGTEEWTIEYIYEYDSHSFPKQYIRKHPGSDDDYPIFLIKYKE